jgi:carboxyl-terminal processing protease
MSMTGPPKRVIAVLGGLSVALCAFAAGLLVAGGPSEAKDDGPTEVAAEVNGEQGIPVLSDALDEILSNAVDPPSEKALVRGALRGMIKVLKKSDDPYALFYSPQGYKNFQELTTGRFSGIGVWVKPRGARLEIVSVLPDTPALEAGLRRGDIVMAVEGRHVSEMTPDEAVARIKGPEGTSVDLEIKRDGEVLEFSITRADLELPNLQARLTNENFGYIHLMGFARGAGRQLRAEVERFVADGAEGIILDLRDNGGGLFDEAIDVASIFIENGDVVIYREQNQDDAVYEARGDAFEDVPVVVLVNEGTASASEIVAGALQDRERAVLVGTTTYGKGAVQEIIPLLDSSALKLTTAAYLTPSGSDINGEGIEPDVVVDAGFAAQKARATEILEGIVLSTSGSQG